MEPIALASTRCAICNTEGNATEVYAASFVSDTFSPGKFSARRLPDRVHFRIVRCNTCGLVRSDPVADSAILARLYSQSTFDYSDEAMNLRLTYGRYLAKLASYDVQKLALLEIGCGNGFFLEEAMGQGYAMVRGVEPSADSVARVKPNIRSLIVCDIMRPGLFQPEEFDVVCMFQVFDHIPDPSALLAECNHLLKPGGLVLCINHNIEAMSARIFKRSSPIIDIEHTYLFSPRTMSQIFLTRGFRVMRVGSVYNMCTAYYLARLMPLPSLLKRAVMMALAKSHIGRICLCLPLGNLYLIAQKPHRGV